MKGKSCSFKKDFIVNWHVDCCLSVVVDLVALHSVFFNNFVFILQICDSISYFLICSIFPFHHINALYLFCCLFGMLVISFEIRRFECEKFLVRLMHRVAEAQCHLCDFITFRWLFWDSQARKYSHKQMVSGYVESGSQKAARFRCLVFVKSAISWKELSLMKWDGFRVHNKSLIISLECDPMLWKRLNNQWVTRFRKIWEAFFVVKFTGFYCSQMCCLDYLRNWRV